MFGFIHGPLIWAIVTFQAKHYPVSLDRFTSLFIHIMPCVVCYVMMWKQPPATNLESTFMFGRTWSVSEDGDCDVDLLALWVWPMLFLLLHMVVMLPCQVRPDAFGCGEQMTSYKWMTRKKD